MLVYRIEHSKDRLGPYRISDDPERDGIVIKMAIDHCDGFHPLPRRLNSTDHYCGMESIKDLRCWFHGFWDALKDCGYLIGVYSIEEFIEIDYTRQVVFDRTKAVWEKDMPM